MPKLATPSATDAFFIALTDPTSESKQLNVEDQKFLHAQRGSFPFLLHANSEGEIVGAQIVGHGHSEVLARSDSHSEEREQLLLVNAAETATQAE